MSDNRYYVNTTSRSQPIPLFLSNLHTSDIARRIGLPTGKSSGRQSVVRRDYSAKTPDLRRSGQNRASLIVMSLTRDQLRTGEPTLGLRCQRHQVGIILPHLMLYDLDRCALAANRTKRCKMAIKSAPKRFRISILSSVASTISALA